MLLFERTFLFVVTAAAVWAQPTSLDVVFLVDESGSMDDVQQNVRDNIPFIFSELNKQTNGNFRAGIVGFGAAANSGMPLRRQRLTVDQGLFTSAANALTASGGFEPGLRAITDTATNALKLGPVSSFPGPKGFCAIIFTDEDSDVPSGSSATAERTAASTAMASSALFSIINRSDGLSAEDYGTRADGGFAEKTYDINSFNEATANSVISDIIDICVRVIGTDPRQEPRKCKVKCMKAQDRRRCINVCVVHNKCKTKCKKLGVPAQPPRSKDHKVCVRVCSKKERKKIKRKRRKEINARRRKGKLIQKKKENKL